MPARRRTRRHTQTDRPVVDAPGGRNGRVTVLAEAAERIGVGREYRRAFHHGGLQTRNGLPQQWRTGGVLGSEDIVALGILQADVNMEAATGGPRERLGHERTDAAMTQGRALHQPLEQYRFICRTQGIGPMLQCYLELPGRVFAHQRLHGQADGSRAGVEVIEQWGHAFELAKTVSVNTRGRLLAQHGTCRLHAMPFPLEQIELQLRCHHGRVAQGFQSRDRTRQHMTRVSGSRQTRPTSDAFHVVLGHQHLRRWTLQPRSQAQRTGHRPYHLVGVAHTPHQTACFHVFAGDIETKNGTCHIASARK